MTTDEALAALTAARLRLFAASQRREAVVLRRARPMPPETIDTINDDIAAARAEVLQAVLNVQMVIGD